MPTTRPRYSVTDTGELAELLDLAARRWPEVSDRRRLLLRLAQEGAQSIAGDVAALERRERRRLQLDAIEEVRGLVDADALLSDAAWR